MRWRDRDGVRHDCLGNNIELQPKVHDGLSDLRAYAAYDAIGTQHAGGLDRLMAQMRTSHGVDLRGLRHPSASATR